VKFIELFVLLSTRIVVWGEAAKRPVVTSTRVRVKRSFFIGFGF
jgi:hypothetical protein